MKKMEENREAVMVEVRKLLSEHFDAGFAIVTWEHGGETFNSDLKFGNRYAIEGLLGQSNDIINPPDDEDEEEEELI
jgi:hypothetical protein